MKRIRLDKINYRAVREHGTESDQHKLAVRTFNVLRPLYGHLTNAEYTEVLEHVIRDSTPIVLRGIFLVDDNERDLGLIAVRITEIIFNGQTIAHFTIHLGLHPEARGEKHTTRLLWKEIFRYRLKHPLRLCYIIDTPISAASYRKLYKGTAQIFPTPSKPIPENLWPLCESVAKKKGWLPIEGCPKEARFVNRPVTALSANDTRPDSQDYHSTKRWFTETTKDVPGSSVMVIVPLTATNIAMSALKQANHFLKNKSRRMHGK